MKKISFCGLFILILGQLAKAQDAHFSQYYASPLTLNPALTGDFEGKYRVAAIYRSQWDGVVRAAGYNTLSAALDIRFNMRHRKDYFGGGFIFYNDKSGTSGITSTVAGFSGSYHKALDWKGYHFLSGGLQLGIHQRSINYDALTFGDQYNHIDGYTNGTAEQLPRNNFAFMDLATGIFWTYSPSASKSMYAGLAIQHFTRPSIAFDNSDTAPESFLEPKFTLHVGGRIPLKKRGELSLTPRLVTQLQGSHMEMNVGSGMRISLTPYNDQALHIGTWARPVRDVQSGFGMDALVLLAGFEYKSLLVGFSYDMNIGDLTNQGPKRSAFEISVSFMGDYEDSAVVCPTF